MVKINGEIHSLTEDASIFLAIGLTLTVVSTLFYGIKLKWFRYRMNIPSVQQENPVIFRAHSVTEIRENCSEGHYRQSLQEDTLIRVDNYDTPSSSYNVKSKKDDRRTHFFRWPFKSKLTLSKSSSINEDETSAETIRSSQSSSTYSRERSAHELVIAEKNERLRRSIYERLNSKSSVSMPDLVQCDENNMRAREYDNNNANESRKLTIQKGIEVSLDETIDEIQEIKIEKLPVLAKVVSDVKISEINEDEEEVAIAEIVKPPTPIRRRSRSNSLRPQNQDDESTQIINSSIPPAIIPRKKNINYNETPNQQHDENIINEVNFERRQSDATLKSILKTSDVSTNAKTNVHFINVPDSSSSSEDESNTVNKGNDDEDDDYAIWRKIDIHRDQLSKKYNLYDSDDDEIPPPPLPKTPPPTATNIDREFKFA